jgi:hypothetical protein
LVSAKDYDLTDCADDFLRGQTTCLQDQSFEACTAAGQLLTQIGSVRP